LLPSLRLITVKSPIALASAVADSGIQLSTHLPLQFDVLPVVSRS